MLTKLRIVGLVLVQRFSSLSLFLFHLTLPHARVRVAYFRQIIGLHIIMKKKERSLQTSLNVGFGLKNAVFLRLRGGSNCNFTNDVDILMKVIYVT